MRHPVFKCKSKHRKTKKTKGITKTKDSPDRKSKHTMFFCLFSVVGVFLFGLSLCLFWFFCFFWFWADGPGWAPRGSQQAPGGPGLTRTDQEAHDASGGTGRPGRQPNTKNTQGTTTNRTPLAENAKTHMLLHVMSGVWLLLC